MTTCTEEKTEVHAESTDVSACLAADPENTQLVLGVVFNQLAVVDGTNTELTLDSGNQRRTLKKGTSQFLKSLLENKLIFNSVVKADDGHVFLTSSLLALHQTSCSVNANDQTTSDLRIEGTTVACTLTVKNFLYPGNHLMR